MCSHTGEISYFRIYRQLRARRVLSIFKDAPPRTRRALLLHKVSMSYFVDRHTNQLLYLPYLSHRYFHHFGLGGEIRDICDDFITINCHILKWKFSRGLTCEICENKTTAKITMYTVTQYIFNTPLTQSCIIGPIRA